MEPNQHLEKENAQLKEMIVQQFWHPQSFMDKGEIFKFWTGIAPGVFQALNDYLACNYSSLYLKHGNQRKVHEEPSTVKLGRPRALSYEAELFLVLLKLRHASKDDLLAILFGLSSKSQVSSIFTARVPHLAHELAPIMR